MSILYSLLTLVFLVMGGLYGLAYSKKEIVINRLYAGLSLALSGFMLFLFAALDPYRMFPNSIMAFWESAFWAFEICTVAFSIKEMSIARTPSQKRSEFAPVGQVILAMFLFGAAFFIAFESITRHMPSSDNAVPKVSHASSGQTHTFEKFNLSYKVPSGSWLEFNIGPQAPPSLLISMFQANPAAYFVISANAGFPLEKERGQSFYQLAYAEAMKDKDNKVTNQKVSEVIGINGYLFESEHSLPNTGQRVRRIHWMGEKNGFLYEFVASAPMDMSLEDLRHIFDEHVRGISLVQEGKTSTPTPIKEDYQSRRYPYVIHAKNKEWVDWWVTSDSEGVEWADYKLAKSAHLYFMVFPVIFKDEAPPIDILAKALLKFNVISYDKVSPSDISPVKENGYEGFNISHERETEVGNFQYRIKILRNKKIAFFVTAFNSEKLAMGAGDTDKSLEEGRSMFDAQKPGALPEFKDFTPQEKKRHAVAYAWIANVYYNMDKKIEALPYMKEAYELDPEDKEYLHDIMTLYEDMDLQKEGVQYMEQHNDVIKDSPRLRKKFADLASKTSDWKNAQQMYEKLIKEGNIKQGLLYDYLDLMKKNNAEKEAYKKLKELSSSVELETRVAIAGLLADENQNEDALSIIRDLYEKQPRDTELSNGFFYQLLKMERYKDVVDNTAKHLKEYDDDADIYFFRGFAFTALKRFDEAIVAFKKAHELEPDSEYFKSFVDCLTQLKNQVSGKMLPYNLNINRTMTLDKSVLKVEETLKFIGRDAAAWKDELDETTESQKKDKIKAMLKSFYGKSEIESLEIVSSENDSFEMKIIYSLLDLFQNVGSKQLIWLPRAWEVQYLVPAAAENSEMPLSILPPMQIHAQAVLHYSPETEMEISDIPEESMAIGCVEIQSKFSQEEGSFKYDMTYSRAGGTFMSSQIEQCQSDISEGFKKSMPSFLVKKFGDSS